MTDAPSHEIQTSHHNESSQAELIHDVLNFVAAAKMNTEMALRNKELPLSAKKNLERVAVNLVNIQERLRGAASPFADSANEAQALAIATNLTAAGEKNVLVIDDSPDIRSLFKAILTPHGYTVNVAGDVREALTVLANPPYPQLILLDYSLGDLTATSLLDKLQAAQSPVFEKSRIVMLTGFGDSIKEARVSAVEQKALSTSELLDIVKKYIMN